MLRQFSNRVVHSGAVLAAIVLALWAFTASGHEGVAEFVRKLGQTAIHELAPDGITQAERETRFRALLQANFDLPRITRFVLGRYVRSATPEQMTEFTTLYEDLMTLTYARLFASYAGESFTVLREAGDPGSRYSLVLGQIGLPSGGAPIALDWQILTSDDGSHRVVDLKVEGVSLAIAQRDEFTAVLDRNGGNIDALLDEIRGRIGKLRPGGGPR